MISSTKTRTVCHRPKWGAVSSTCRVIVIARVSATATKTPPATRTRSRFRYRIPAATTAALVHHPRRNEIRPRRGDPNETMNSEPPPYNGSSGNKTAIRAAAVARRTISRRGSLPGVVCMLRMLVRRERQETDVADSPTAVRSGADSDQQIRERLGGQHLCEVRQGVYEDQPDPSEAELVSREREAVVKEGSRSAVTSSSAAQAWLAMSQEYRTSSIPRDDQAYTRLTGSS